MPVYYVDTRLGSDGTGTSVNPYNTAASLSLSDGDTALFACGSVIPASTTSGIIDRAVTVGEYGTGDKPTIDGSAERADWTPEGSGLWSREYASNTVGNVTQDGEPLTFVAWGSWPNAAAVAAALSAGSFTFDYSGLRLYIKPLGAAVIGSVFRVSESLYGLRSLQTRTGLTLQNLRIRGVTAHGLVMLNRRALRVTGLEFEQIGGARDTSRNVHYGNGIELGPGCVDCEVSACDASDIFDSAYTSQTYGSTAALSDHEWRKMQASRCGLAGLEIANIDAYGSVHSIWADGMTLEDIGVNCWPGNRAGVGFSTYNHAANGRITNVHFRGVRARNVRKLWTSGATSGVNSAHDCRAVNALDYVASSNRLTNLSIPGTTQRDMWCDVSDDLGRSPSNDPGSPGQNGSEDGCFVQVAGAWWPGTNYVF